MGKLLEWSADEASGDALDHSGNGLNLSFTANNISRVTGHTNSGLQQTTTSATTAPITGLLTASRTVEFWLRVNASGTYWIMEHYRSASMSGTNDTGIWGLLYLSGTLRWRAKNPSNTPTDITITPDIGVWHHIAAVFDGTKLFVYRDGTLINTGGTTISGGLWLDADTFRVFDTCGSAATIDDVRVYDTALTQPQIAADMALAASAAPVNSGTLTGSFSSPTASFTGASIPKDSGSIAGSFSSPTVAISGTATANVTLGGTFAAPAVNIAGSAAARGVLAGDFAAPVFTGEASSAGVNTGELNGSFTPPVVAAVGRASASGAMIGTFAAPVFSGAGGLPLVNRDILVTIGPGERPATSIAAGPARTRVLAGDFKRTEIGA